MYIGDLHIHSKYSRATSRDCTPEYLDLWARKKGIDIIGTGDFTHPAWREELKEKLKPAEDGLYVLKDDYRIKDGTVWDDKKPRFVVTGEISSIYKKMDRVRKVHSLLLLPGLEEADNLARRLELIGNVHSDGRPILGLSCRDLLEVMLETSPEGIYVPAHIWTPHFSLFGAFSGFDHIEDCFEDLTPHIHALETGLSSDPPMNWRVSALDNYHLISNSDAHSPAKLGREANLFDIELSYSGLARAINDGQGLLGTLEFFPEEGKYHFDGHRKCSLCIDPKEAKKYGNICPVCGKKLTIGVLHRVEELADRDEGYEKESAPPFESLVPLPEVIAASIGSSSASKKVQAHYDKMIKSLGAEFSILRQVPLEDIRRVSGPLVAEGIKRLRDGNVERSPGFDGEYGKIHLLYPSEISLLQGQLSLFSQEELIAQEMKAASEKNDPFRMEAAAPLSDVILPEESLKPKGKTDEHQKLNLGQREAVEAVERAVAVIAGPGTGKTKTLISRLIYMLEERKVDPQEITAVTFTNKAAEEMSSRLKDQPGGKRMEKQMHIGTFHSICSRILQENGLTFSIADEGLQEDLAKKTIKKFELKLSPTRFLRQVSRFKSGQDNDALDDSLIPHEAINVYQQMMEEMGAMDYDDLLLKVLHLTLDEETDYGFRKYFTYLLVDEFQDISPIQYQLIQSWNKGGKEIFVIGDPDQSIYGFRGSDAHCFARLGKDYPNLRLIRLEDNYRLTPQILSSALSVISKNGGETRKMQAVRESGAPVRVVSAANEKSEAIFIAKEINRLIGGIDMLDVEDNGGHEVRKIRSFSDISVVYRTHRQSKVLENCLRQEGIPYVVVGREDFLLDNKVRAALYFFQYVLHREDSAAQEMARKLIFEECEHSKEQLDLLADNFEKSVRKSKPVKLLESWAKDLRAEDNEAVKKLTDMSVLYPSMEVFLQTLSFGEEGDIRRCGGRKFLNDAVNLMTFHGSKGLEFPVAFLYGLRKGLLPLELGNVTMDVQEERRLFYVGMTRAREELIITTSQEESRFLNEVSDSHVQREIAKKETPVEEATQLNLFDFM